MDPMLTLVLASVGIGCSGEMSGRSLVKGGSDASSSGGAGAVGSGGYATGGLGAAGGIDGADTGATVTGLSIGVCTHPVVDESNWVSCDEGFTHRATPGTCTTTLPRGPIGNPPDAGYIRCTTDTECSWLLYGHCAGGLTSPTHCAAGCVTDADCGAGKACLCGNGGVGECIDASCTVDADCKTGSFCATYGGIEDCAVGDVGVKCQQPTDECVGNDCGTTYCQLSGGIRKCLPGVGGCGGRPFLVQGRERVADVALRADWLETSVPSVRLTSLSDRDRRRAAEHWTRMSQMEHASIAAFARFSLELLALGAPGDLVAETGRAMSDEQRHAAACFALASAYAGHAIGPGALAIDGSVVTPTLESVVETTLLEGCIGELVATAEAREAALVATDPFVSRTLVEIANDESRHAALAWRFLNWAIERGGARLLDRARRIVSTELERARRRAARATAAPSEGSSALGILPEADCARLRVDVIERVVLAALGAMRARAIDGSTADALSAVA